MSLVDLLQSPPRVRYRSATWRHCHIRRMLIAVVCAVGVMLAAVAPAAVANPYHLYGCVRATDAIPSTPARDIQVAFGSSGHPNIPTYYRDIGIDAANAWYAAVHDMILIASSGASQIATNAINRGNDGFAAYTQKGAGPKLEICTSSQNYFSDDTWIVMNTWFTNTYSDNLNRAVFVHEFGHAVGLGHTFPEAHTNSPAGDQPCDAVMYRGVVSAFPSCGSWVPRWNDVFGIQYLY